MGGESVTTLPPWPPNAQVSTVQYALIRVGNVAWIFFVASTSYGVDSYGHMHYFVCITPTFYEQAEC